MPRNEAEETGGYGTDAASARKFMKPTVELVAFGRCVKEKRRLLGLRQQDLADACGFTRTSITNIEQGRQDVPLSRAHAIAGALGCQLSVLLGGNPLILDHAGRLAAENQRLREILADIARSAGRARLRAPEGSPRAHGAPTA